MIDSGVDWLGSMHRVAVDVRGRWLALTPEQLRRFATMSGNVLTLGPTGVAEVCRTLEARHFLLYAHWWGAIGAHGEDELALLEALQAELHREPATTQIVPWRIGESTTAGRSSRLELIRGER